MSFFLQVGRSDSLSLELFISAHSAPHQQSCPDREDSAVKDKDLDVGSERP